MKAVSITVWVCLKAVVTEKSKEKNKPIKTNLNDNDQLQLHFASSSQYLPNSSKVDLASRCLVRAVTTNSFFCASAYASKRLSLLCNFSKRDVSSVNCDANVLLPEGRLLRNSAKASFWSCNLFNSFDCSFFAADSLEWSLEFIDEDEAACDKDF